MQPSTISTLTLCGTTTEGVGLSCGRLRRSSLLSGLRGRVRFAVWPVWPLESNPRCVLLRSPPWVRTRRRSGRMDRPKHLWFFLRRGWDSNPRVLTDAGFQDRCIEPLCHPSSVLHHYMSRSRTTKRHHPDRMKLGTHHPDFNVPRATCPGGRDLSSSFSPLQRSLL